MVKPKDPKTNSLTPYRKGAEVATPDQLRVIKTLDYASEKKSLGLADADMRTILKGVHMPNANLSVGSRRMGVSVSDSDPRDPIKGADPIGPGQDGDPPFWRTDMDPTDPARRPDRNLFA